VSSIPLADRLGRETLLLALIDKLVSVPFVIEGSVAAVAQGAPLPVGALEIAVARDGLQALHTVLERLAALRWVTRLRIYGYAPVDPQLPGPLRWRTHLGDIALRIVDELPCAVRIGVGQRVLVVRPITELEAADQATRRILARVRQRMAAA
jgi:hypothetical protein